MTANAKNSQSHLLMCVVARNRLRFKLEFWQKKRTNLHSTASWSQTLTFGNGKAIQAKAAMTKQLHSGHQLMTPFQYRSLYDIYVRSRKWLAVRNWKKHKNGTRPHLEWIIQMATMITFTLPNHLSFIIPKLIKKYGGAVISDQARVLLRQTNASRTQNKWYLLSAQRRTVTRHDHFVSIIVIYY